MLRDTRAAEELPERGAGSLLESARSSQPAPSPGATPGTLPAGPPARPLPYPRASRSSPSPARTAVPLHLVKAKYMRLTMVKLSRVMVCGR